jgi:hypothetical protein
MIREFEKIFFTRDLAVTTGLGEFRITHSRITSNELRLGFVGHQLLHLSLPPQIFGFSTQQEHRRPWLRKRYRILEDTSRLKYAASGSAHVSAQLSKMSLPDGAPTLAVGLAEYSSRWGGVWR